MGSIDPGLLVISGRVKDGIDLKDAESEIEQVITELKTNGPTEEELFKVKNLAISTLEFGEVEVINRAMNLAFSALSGDPELVNSELDCIQEVKADDIQRLANQILNESNSNVLYYHAEQTE
jgi:zinc protease